MRERQRVIKLWRWHTARTGKHLDVFSVDRGNAGKNEVFFFFFPWCIRYMYHSEIWFTSLAYWVWLRQDFTLEIHFTFMVIDFMIILSIFERSLLLKQIIINSSLKMNGDTYADSLYLHIQDLNLYWKEIYGTCLFIGFVCFFIFLVLSL